MDLFNQYKQGLIADLPWMILIGLSIVGVVIWSILRRRPSSGGLGEETLRAFDLEGMRRTGLINEDELKKVRHGMAGVIQKELELKSGGGMPTQRTGESLAAFAGRLQAEMGDDFERALGGHTEEEKRQLRAEIERQQKEWAHAEAKGVRYVDDEPRGVQSKTTDGEPLESDTEAPPKAASKEAIPNAVAPDEQSDDDEESMSPWGDLKTEEPQQSGAAAGRPNLEAMREAGVIDEAEYERLVAYYRAKKSGS